MSPNLLRMLTIRRKEMRAHPHAYARTQFMRRRHQRDHVLVGSAPRGHD
jgi:hypothetical protein